MAIKFGTGVRGALGRMRDIESQYVGLPYKEMMAGNLLRQAAYDKSEEKLDNLSELYNVPMLPQDEQLIQDREDQFNTQLDEKMQEVGGDLGKLTGFLSGKFRNQSNDKVYRRALQAKEDYLDYEKNLNKRKLSPTLHNYYLNKSLTDYQGADKGSFMGAPPAALSEAKLDEMLRKRAKGLYDTAPKIKQNVPVIISEDGIVVWDASKDKQDDQYQYLDSSGKVKKGFEIRQIPKEYRQRSGEDISIGLQNAIAGSAEAQELLRDLSNATGMSYEDMVKNKISSLPQEYRRSDYTEGNIYKTTSDKEKTSRDNLIFNGEVLKFDTSNFLTTKDETGTPSLEPSGMLNKMYNLNALASNNLIDAAEYSSEASILYKALSAAETKLGRQFTEQEMQQGYIETPKMREKLGRNPMGEMEEYKAQVKIDDLLEESLQEILDGSNFSPGMESVVEIGGDGKKSLLEFESRIQSAPGTIMDVQRVKDKESEWAEPTEKQIKQTDWENIEISEISTRPIYDGSTGKFVYKINGTYTTGSDNKKEEHSFEGTIPEGRAQTNLFDDLGWPALTGTKKAVSRLVVEGQTVIPKKLSELAFLKYGKDVTLGVVLRNGKYEVVAVDPQTFTPLYGEQPYSPAFPNTDSISKYIKEMFKKEKAKINK